MAKKKKDPKLVKKRYKLKKGVNIGGKEKKPGQTVYLTETGYRFFRAKKIV